MPDVARTLDLPSGQRFEYWKHVLSHTFVALEVRCPGGDGDFRGRLRGCELGSLRFIEVLADAHTARRTPRLVKAAPAGCYKIGLQLRGSSVLIQDGREATLTPGDFTLYDTDRPYTLAFGDPHRMLVLVFPRDMLGLPQSRLAQLTATRLPGEAGGLATLIGPFLGQVLTCWTTRIPRLPPRPARDNYFPNGAWCQRSGGWYRCPFWKKELLSCGVKWRAVGCGPHDAVPGQRPELVRHRCHAGSGRRHVDLGWPGLWAARILGGRPGWPAWSDDGRAAGLGHSPGGT